MDPIHFDYFILPLLIFFARIADVSIGTIRIIFINKGCKKIAPILGFFEVLIWVVAISKLMNNVTNFWMYIFYALGFSAGTYVGMFLEEKLSVGKVMIRIIVKKNCKELIDSLREHKYPLTILSAVSGLERKEVKIIFSVVDKKDMNEFFEILNKTNPNAFYSVEDVRFARENFVRPRKNFFGQLRKAK